MQQWFKDWFNSHYYHLLYQNRDEQEALDFIQKLIAHLNPMPAAKMLDVACGKGRHSKALADYGFDVTGIDLSEESIAEAKEQEADNLHFIRMTCDCLFGSIITILLLICSLVLAISKPSVNTIMPLEPWHKV